MEQQKLIISPKTKIGELLDAFPQLENVLINLSPSFAKLKNPILRKTVAKVASLQQAAVIGGLQVNELVNRLRKEVGQDISSEKSEDAKYIAKKSLQWYSQEAVVESFDATSIINSGGSPMAEILERTKKLQKGEIFELTTPFVPAPIIDMLKEKGFESFSIQNDKSILSYFINTSFFHKIS